MEDVNHRFVLVAEEYRVFEAGWKVDLQLGTPLNGGCRVSFRWMRGSTREMINGCVIVSRADLTLVRRQSRKRRETSCAEKGKVGHLYVVVVVVAAAAAMRQFS